MCSRSGRLRTARRAIRALSPFVVAAALIVPRQADALAQAVRTPRGPDCGNVTECTRLALEAAERGAYETFHDLVWRAIQTNGRQEPDLLFLLARAQSLSNRPTDALVVLRRLAEMGRTYDALTHEDLRAVRSLPGWPALASLIARVDAAAASAAAASAPSDVSPSPRAAPTTSASAAPPAVEPAPAPLPRAGPPVKARPNAAATVPPPSLPAPALKIQPMPVTEVARFSTERFVPGGLAYDSVSRRFVFGDLQARKLIVLGEGTDRPVDLVRADSAGFHDVAALEIDRARGDLWVVSSDANGDGVALHKLQLVSGRPLATYDAPPELQPVRFVDVAVTRGGTVLVLGTAASQLLRLRPREKALEPLAQLGVAGATSLAPSDDGSVVYVAHPDGMLRVEVATGKASPVSAPGGVDLRRLERIRWHRDAVVGVQASEDGTARVVRLRLNRAGTAVTDATVIDASLRADSGPTFATVAGDELYYLVMRAGARALTETVVRLVQLR